jgi:hypothetical protein
MRSTESQNNFGCFSTPPSRIPNSAPIARMTKFCIAVTVLCVVFRLVEWMHRMGLDVLVDTIQYGYIRMQWWIWMLMLAVDVGDGNGADALIDGNSFSGLIVALRSLCCAQFCHLHLC